jgi:V/A-type H+-transporting ATPase subunit I
MSKVSIALHSTDKEKLLKQLQEDATLHINSVEEQQENGTNHIEDEERKKQLEASLSRISSTISFLKRFVKKGGFITEIVPQKLPVPHETFKNTVEETDAEKLTEKVNIISTKLSKLKSEKEHIQTNEEVIKPWLGLDIPFEELTPTKTTNVLTGTIKKKIFNNLQSTTDEEKTVEIEKIGESKNAIYAIIAYHKSDESEAREFLDEIDFSYLDLRKLKGKPKDTFQHIKERKQQIEEETETLMEEVKELTAEYEKLLILYDHTADEIVRLKTAMDTVQTKTSYIIEGWVETKKLENLKNTIKTYDASEIIELKPEKDERPPVKLVNERIFQPFEIITQLYGTPNYQELDPSPLLALFFAMFFGLCITDAGYGIVLAIIALALMRKMPEGRKFLWLIFIGAVFTIVEGALLGGWFGNLFDGTFIERTTKSMMVFDPMKSYFIFYRLALAAGVIQIYWGLIIKLYEEIKRKNYADALIEAVIWLIILTSGLVWLFSSDFCIQLNLSSKKLLPGILQNPSLYILFFCGLIVVIFGARKEKNPAFRLFLGVLRFFILGGIFSYVGDFLSYIRLMALGLVTAGIANAINDIARMTLNIPIFGIIIFVAILVGGHLFNIGINTLGGFVHTLRLQYVEFFQKFFTGGGKSFSPLKRNEKYILIKKT